MKFSGEIFLFKYVLIESPRPRFQVFFCGCMATFYIGFTSYTANSRHNTLCPSASTPNNKMQHARIEPSQITAHRS